MTRVKSRFIKDIINYIIIYDDTIDTEIHAYITTIHSDDYLSILDFDDADHGTNKNDGKSPIGYVFLIMEMWSESFN